MGEMAEYILNGDDCQCCGVYIGPGDGFPRSCAGCKPRNEEMSDTEMWRGLKKAKQQKRASNRDNSAQMLTDAGISFEPKNAGAHLIVKSNDWGVIDFWPGTGLWIRRSTKRRNHGVKALINLLKTTK